MRATVVLVLALVAASQCLSADQRLPRDNLLLFRGDDGQSRKVTTVEDWQKRRAEIIRGMESIMGRLPGREKRCALDVKVEEEVDCGK